MTGRQIIVWAPQSGPQKALIDCPLPEIFFGGARGGGKTDGILGKWAIKANRYGRHFNAVFFRKELPQQDDVVERAKQIFCSVGAKWSEYRRIFAMPGGGRIRFRPLADLADAEKYQGQNLSDAAVEEAGNYPSPAPIDRLFGCLRSTTGVPVQLILTANPAGPGHQWIKMRYVDPAPHGMRTLERKLPSGNVHRYVFIPSKVQDNQILLKGDPGYVDRLHLVGNEQLVKAWLEGDWSVIAGAFFPEFSLTRHVRDPFEIPESWSRYRACDWGSAKPFSVGWYAISDGSLPAVPRGCLVKYREWYGMQPGQPNVGLKMTAEEVADGIKLREVGETINQAISRLDPSCFAEDGGPSIAERMLRRSVIWNRADNTRVGRRGAMGGWDQVRARLIGEEGRPMILFFSTCQHTIRTLPALQHDQAAAEDVDTDGEDHAPDETRYACMARPYVPTKIERKPFDFEHVKKPTFDDVIEMSERPQARRRI